MTLETQAKAIVVEGKIFIASVAPTRLGAIINWLVAECGVPIFQNTSDGEIETIWERLRGSASVVDVTVTYRN